jgi:hypothetical protein
LNHFTTPFSFTAILLILSPYHNMQIAL